MSAPAQQNVTSAVAKEAAFVICLTVDRYSSPQTTRHQGVSHRLRKSTTPLSAVTQNTPKSGLQVDSDLVIQHDPAMAKEKVYSEVLNLRLDEAMSMEIKRIATQRETPESETARMLIEWGIEAHRAREVAQLQLRYDVDTPHDRHGDPLVLKVQARWVPVDEWDD